MFISIAFDWIFCNTNECVCMRIKFMFCKKISSYFYGAIIHYVQIHSISIVKLLTNTISYQHYYHYFFWLDNFQYNIIDSIGITYTKFTFFFSIHPFLIIYLKKLVLTRIQYIQIHLNIYRIVCMCLRENKNVEWEQILSTHCERNTKEYIKKNI